jgi:ABC-type transport system substrate-binding protein
MDYNWLVAHGAGITFTPAGFAEYMNQGNETDYNNYIRYNVMGSGPYMVKSYIIGQSVELEPNPNYTPIPGVPGWDHTANDTINIQWEKDPLTVLLMAETGQADLMPGYGLPFSYYPIFSHLQSEGKLNITTFPTIIISWLQFNFNINTTMLSTLGTGYSVPQYYFANLDVRRAFAYAFNYTNFINNIVGNKVYGADFGFHYTGIIPLGMAGYMNATQLQQAGAVVPVYNLSIAKQYLEESGLYNISINIPIVVDAGDPTDFTAAQDWATTLNSIDPNIHANAIYMEYSEEHGFEIANQNPMPIYYYMWGPDYPFPSDYVIPMYSSTGYFGGAAGYNATVLESSGQYNQTNIINQTNQYILDAQNTGNTTLALKYYDQAEVLAVNLTFYVYLMQSNYFWYSSPLLRGIQNIDNTINYEVFIYLSK